MSRETVDRLCLSLPGAELSEPFGPGIHVWKVGGRIFACNGSTTPGVSVKTDSVGTAEMLIAAGVGTKAPYFHRSWLLLPWTSEPEDLRHRIAASYRLVRASLPKKVAAALAPLP